MSHLAALPDLYRNYSTKIARGEVLTVSELKEWEQVKSYYEKTIYVVKWKFTGGDPEVNTFYIETQSESLIREYLDYMFDIKKVIILSIKKNRLPLSRIQKVLQKW